jgi:hypothetical protein
MSRSRLPALALGVLLGSAAATAGGCASKARTPEEAYRRFSAAVTENDGGALFDALDQSSRWAWMTIQKWHREAYDIVLSNYPEGTDRERERRRFEPAATATSGRELFKAEVAPGVLPLLRPLVAADARVETDPSGTEAAAVLVSGARVPLARQGSSGWGFAGLAREAEDHKSRAYHDLEVVRASAADYERAAARAGK